MNILKSIYRGGSKAVKKMQTPPVVEVSAKEQRLQRGRDYKKRIDNARRNK
jgi:hypothetical protein